MKTRTKLQGKSKEQGPRTNNPLRDRTKVAAQKKVAAQTERPRDEVALGPDVKDAAAERRALELLGSPNFFGELFTAVARLGLVGEQTNALVVFIVCVSRLLEKTLCLLVKGRSSAGKNYLTDKILALFPQTEIQNLTSASLRSWNYRGDQLAHKIVYVAERNEQVGHLNPTRLLISEQKLVHSVTVKRDGHFVQETYETKGPIAAISTTTSNTVEVDDETRHISIWIDESPEQTTRILNAALTERRGLDENELTIWHEVQRVLQKRAELPIEFPGWFATVSQFVRNDDVRVRRYFPAFLQACKVVALIRSFRLEEKKILAEGKITVKFTDFATAALIFNPIFEQSLDGAKQEDDIQTQQAVRRISTRNDGDAVSASDLAKELNVSPDKAYRMLRDAAASGTIVRANDSTQTNLKLYLPTTKRAFLPDPEEVFHRLRDSSSKRVTFVHPLTSATVEYRRED